jgi:hypothetical protein
MRCNRLLGKPAVKLLPAKASLTQRVEFITWAILADEVLSRPRGSLGPVVADGGNLASTVVTFRLFFREIAYLFLHESRRMKKTLLSFADSFDDEGFFAVNDR